MAAAICRTTGDRDEVVRRLTALDRWRPETISGVLWQLGVPTARRSLRAAPQLRGDYAKLRRHGIGTSEALRELGL